MKKKQLRKSEIKDIAKKVEELYGKADLLTKNDSVIIGQTDKNKIIYINGEPLFFYEGDMIIPTLKLLAKENLLKKVTVDMGAVRFVANGADVMRPGITAADKDIQKDEYIAVVDENNDVCLAVCKALFSGDEMMAMQSGKVLANIHRAGDEVWHSCL